MIYIGSVVLKQNSKQLLHQMILFWDTFWDTFFGEIEIF